jgi:hypothetical protein
MKEINRPAARLARAEALARSGRPEEAAREVRRAALEPLRSGDQPWALVPLMARVQGLIALAGGDRTAARRRLNEAVAGWRRHLPRDPGAEFRANFIDLGRSPITGLVEPEWELRRLTAELAPARPSTWTSACPSAGRTGSIGSTSSSRSHCAASPRSPRPRPDWRGAGRSDAACSSSSAQRGRLLAVGGDR